jgi:hypothetical protein
LKALPRSGKIIVINLEIAILYDATNTRKKEDSIIG